MYIKNINLKNFKCFNDRLFTFTQKVEINGKNGSGKSTIAEAIVFALYNRTLSGSKDTDSYIGKGQDFCEVIIDTDQGKIRRLKSKQTRIWLDGEQVTQEVLEEKLNLPDFEVFNSIFSAGYFQALDESTQRQIILDLTEDVNLSDLFHKMGGKDELLEKWNISLDDIENGHKEVGKRKVLSQKSLETTKIEIETYTKEVSQLYVVSGLELENKATQIKNLIDKKSEQLEELAKYERDSETYDKFKSLIEQKEQLKKWLSENPIKEVPKTKSLTEEKTNLLREFVSIPQGLECPTCQQKISAKHKKEIQDHNDLLSKRIEQIDRTLEEVRELDSYNQKVMSEQNRFDSIDIPDIKKPIKPNVPETLKDDIQDLRNDLSAIQGQIGEIVYKENRKKDLEELIKNHEGSVGELESNIVELKKLADIFSPRGLPNEEMNLKLKPLKTRLQESIPNIDIKLLEILKSGIGFRKVFKISVNGIDYPYLSTGEKKKIDVSFSVILNDLLKDKHNNSVGIIFTDNTESLSDPINIQDGLQLFLAKVTEGNLVIRNL